MRPLVRYSAPQQHRAKTREFTGHAPEINILPLPIQPLSGTHQLPLTSLQLIGMIRGLFCLLFPKKSFEELDGGQLTFRQKTCKTG